MNTDKYRFSNAPQWLQTFSQPQVCNRKIEFEESIFHSKYSDSGVLVAAANDFRISRGECFFTVENAFR